MSNRILVVDDEKEIADLVELYLKKEGFSIDKYYSASQALSRIKDTAYDLAMLDIMMPDVDGFTLCQEIRKSYTYPIIMLTAKDSETDKITGLTLGADDYITKPFQPLEMVARVKSQLRRYKKYNLSDGQHLRPVLCHNGLVINPEKHVCTLNNQPVSLTPTEFAILQVLLENKGRVISGEELLRKIWQDDYYNKLSNSVTVHIRHIREKLNDSLEKPKYIQTIWGVGYKIDDHECI